LNRAIVLGKVEGAAAGLTALEAIEPDSRFERYPFLPAAQGEFLRRLGRIDEAADRLGQAFHFARTEPERRFIGHKLADLRAVPPDAGAGPSEAPVRRTPN
jgi:RNA polymerase sigma-70 factor, ECF subfamily